MQLPAFWPVVRACVLYDGIYSVREAKCAHR
jgi:hypothetical protein